MERNWRDITLLVIVKKKKVVIDSNVGGVKLIFWFEDLVAEMGS